MYVYSGKDISNGLACSMANEERMAHLHRSVYQVGKVEGALVEVGVCKGGSSVCMALSSITHKCLKKIYLYDTFAGMSIPSEHDIKLASGKDPSHVMEKWKRCQKDNHNEWCLGTINTVKSNMQKTRYPTDLIEYHIGNITHPTDFIPDKISLLRIDVDFYEPTKAALEKFFPRLVNGGILIMDDYGCWAGAKKAWDDYDAEHGLVYPLHVIDKSAVCLTKWEK